MVLFTIRLLKKISKALREDDSPRRLAIGFALGMLIGLVPKGNLIAATLAVLLLAIRCNLVAAALSTGLFSLLGVFLDPISHRIGWILLTKESWQPYWVRFYELPLVPWTGLNNTIAMGGFVLGLALVYPAYHLSRLLFERHRQYLVARWKHLNADAWLDRADKATSWRVS